MFIRYMQSPQHFRFSNVIMNSKLEKKGTTVLDHSDCLDAVITEAGEDTNSSFADTGKSSVEVWFSLLLK